MEQLIRPLVFKIAFIETVILSIALVDAIDIIARIIAALAAVFIAVYTIKKLKVDTELSATKLKREQFEQKKIELEVEEKFKELNNLK